MNKMLSLQVPTVLFAGALLGVVGLSGCDARANVTAPAAAPAATAGPHGEPEVQPFFAIPYEAFIAQCQAEERAARTAVR